MVKIAGKEVSKVYDLFSFALAILAGVIANLICDCVKGHRNDDK